MRYEEKGKFKQRLRDAKEFLESAFDNLNKNRFKAALIDAGDCVIASNDAFTIFMIEERASTDHAEAIAVHKKAGQKISENKVNILKTILDLRHKQGYRSVEVGKRIATRTVRDTEKFLKWVDEKLRYF